MPSWFLREGADLFNQNASSRGDASRIVPLDPVLDSSGVRLARHTPFGMRIARKVSPRYTAEFTLDVSSAGIELTDDARGRIEEARASVESGLTSLLRGTANPTVRSRATITETSGRQIATVGTLRINLLRGRRLTPYATAGGGVISRRGDLPTVALVGSYRFTSGNGVLYDQTDFVDVAFVDHGRTSRETSGREDECSWEGCSASLWSRSATAVPA